MHCAMETAYLFKKIEVNPTPKPTERPIISKAITPVLQYRFRTPKTVDLL